MQIIDGKKTAQDIKKEIAAEVAAMVEAGQRPPHLAAILVGNDGGSETYVANKVKACEDCGFESSTLRFDDTITEDQLIAEIQRLNEDPNVDGFIVQLPLPKHINEERVIEAIDYHKDVDGFQPINVGRLSIGLPCFKSVYEYLCKLYKEPLYTAESGVQEQYDKLFTDTDKREASLYIWQTDRSHIALVHWYDSDEDITQYYIKAEPVK